MIEEDLEREFDAENDTVAEDEALVEIVGVTVTGLNNGVCLCLRTKYKYTGWAI